MKKELSVFLEAKAEIKEQLGHGAAASIARKRGVERDAVSRWFRAEKFMKVDEANMEIALGILMERKAAAAKMSRSARQALSA